MAKELEALGHTPRVHEWEIGSGDDIYAWMEQRHDAAEHVLCVVSDEYLKAPYSTLELNAALWQADVPPPRPQRAALPGRRQPARLRAVRGGEAIQAAHPVRPYPPLRTVRHPGGCRAPALSRIHAEARSAGHGRVSRQGVCR